MLYGQCDVTLSNGLSYVLSCVHNVYLQINTSGESNHEHDCSVNLFSTNRLLFTNQLKIKYRQKTCFTLSKCERTTSDQITAG